MRSTRFRRSGPCGRWQSAAHTLVAAGIALGSMAARAPIVEARANESTPVMSSDLGASTTLLPDGRWLVLGGGQTSARLSRAAVLDASGQAVELPATLGNGRAWHTATMLSSGHVLIVGGIGADGHVVTAAELFDPSAMRFVPLGVDAARPTPRALHTATVLLDGTVLYAGGIDAAGAALGTIERWNPRTNTSDEGPLAVARYAHTAVLLADGEVLFWGGFDASGFEIPTGDLFDPATGQHVLATQPAVMGVGALVRLEESLPEDGALEVATDTVLGLRFSAPLAWGPLVSPSITLEGRGHTVAVNLVPAEGGMELFVVPKAPLRAGVTYTFRVEGGVGPGLDAVLAMEPLRFTTAGRKSRAGGSAPEAPQVPTDDRERIDPDEEWIPEDDGRRAWRTGREKSPWQSLPPLKAGKGITALAGQVLRLNGEPITGVRLTIGDRMARTDATGRFLLSGLRPGRAEMAVDGGKAHGFYEVGVNLVAGLTGTFPQPIWLTKIDWANSVEIPSPTTDEVVVSTPRIPGLELRLPWGTVITGHDGKPVRRVSITPIPIDRPPFPLPKAPVPLYFTIQPGGAYIHSAWKSPARLIYPNRTGELGGTRFSFWNYDAEDRGWHIYGQGIVEPSGRQIIPDPGVGIYEFSGAMVVVPDVGDGPVEGGCRDGDPVDLATGLLLIESTDFYLPDLIPIELTRAYRQKDSGRLRPFGYGTSHSYEMYLEGNAGLAGQGDGNVWSWMNLVLPNGAKIYYHRKCQNPDPVLGVCTDGGFYSNAVYVHDETPATDYVDPGPVKNATPSRFYKSKITYFTGPTLAHNRWELTLLDGTVYRFPDAAGQQEPRRGALREIRDRFGNQLTITRDSVGRIQRITSPHGRWLDFTYTGNVVTKIRDVTGREMTYAYAADGELNLVQLLAVTDAEGGITRYKWEGLSDRILEVSDPVRSAICPAPPASCGVHPTLSVQYYGDGTVHTETLADGSSTYEFRYTFPQSGAAAASGGSGVFYCGYCLPAPLVPRAQGTLVKDPNGHWRQEVLNDDGYCAARTTGLTNPEGTNSPDARIVVFGRQSGTNFLTLIEEPLQAGTSCRERKTEFAYYVATGRLQTTTISSRACGGSYTSLVQYQYTYEPRFQQLATIARDNPAQTTTITYDSADPLARPTGIRDATALTYALSHDLLGHLRSVADPIGNTTTLGYEGPDLVTITDPNTKTTTRLLDGAGRVRGILDPLGNWTRYDYDKLDRLRRVTDPRGGIVNLEYDRNSNLQFVRDERHDPDDAVTEYQYDARNFLRVRKDPLARMETYDYDPGGNLRTLTDRLGDKTDVRYDARDRPTCVGFGRTAGGMSDDCFVTTNYDATLGGTIRYTWDVGNRLVVALDSLNGTITRTPDDLGRLGQEQTPLGTVTYTYDNGASRRRTVTVSGQSTVGYCYDQADRLLAIRNGTNCPGSPPLVEFDYDDAGRREWVKLPNGAQQTYGYDPVGRVSSIQYAKADGGILGDLVYFYDANGNVTGTAGVWTRIGLPSPAGGVVSATYDKADRILAWGGTTHQYDFNGNLTTDGLNTYGWNKRHELRTVSGGAAATFTYDAFGRRRAKTVGTTPTAQVVYDGLNPVQERGPTGTVTANLVTGLGIDEYYARTVVSGNVQRSLATDALGSTIALLDQATPTAAVTHYRYEPYGAMSVVPPSQSDGNAMQFTGRENDAVCQGGTNAGKACGGSVDCPSGGTCVSTGLLYYRARYYAPGKGRFVGEDPVGIAGRDLNLHAYVWGSPTSWIDPLGLNGQRALEWARRQIGSDGYGYFSPHHEIRGKNVDFTKGRLSNKCSAFVFDSLLQGGDPAGSPGTNGIPLAGEWAGNDYIPGYPIVPPGEPPLPGDIVSSARHVGIVEIDGGGNLFTISASSRTQTVQRMPWNDEFPGSNYTLRRCACDY